MKFTIDEEYDKLSKREKRIKLYFDQKIVLDDFLSSGAITKAQYDKSFNDLTAKMNILGDDKFKEVVAGIAFSDGRFLIAKRPEGKKRAGLYEFVGGKVEKGESKENALKREFFEELGVEISVKEEFASVLHFYDDLAVHLTVFIVELKGVPEPKEGQSLKFISAAEIDECKFCDADEEILNKIKKLPVV